MKIEAVLEQLGIRKENSGVAHGNVWIEGGEKIASYSPVDGSLIGSVSSARKKDYDLLIDKAQKAYAFWRTVPAPKRGDLIRLIAIELRTNKEALGHLVSFEMGKSLQEGLGEVQEMIDIADFAVGLSR